MTKIYLSDIPEPTYNNGVYKYTIGNSSFTVHSREEMEDIILRLNKLNK